jgi:hypothetical protein
MSFANGTAATLGIAELGNLMLGSDDEGVIPEPLFASAGQSVLVHAKADVRQLIHAKGAISE